MKNKIRWITETAVMLALLVCLQALTKPLGQWVTGPCVNAILALTALLCGMASGLTVALISPVLAFLLGIAPQIVTVPAIMAGNCVYVVVLRLLADPAGKSVARSLLALVASALGKFLVLYLAVAQLICGLFAPALLDSGVLKAPMLKALPATFGLPQLGTALIGGATALLLYPLLRRALRR